MFLGHRIGCGRQRRQFSAQVPVWIRKLQWPDVERRYSHTLGPLSSMVICMFPSVSSWACKLSRVSSTLMRNFRPLEMEASSVIFTVSQWAPEVRSGWREVKLAMTAAAEGFTQSNTLELLEQAVLYTQVSSSLQEHPLRNTGGQGCRRNWGRTWE